MRTFSLNDRQLQGTPGAIAVLHTNTRRLDYHPHVHLVMPAAALDGARKRWPTRRPGKGKAAYLFIHKALAKVFRAKMLAAFAAAGLSLPARHPQKWVVDCKSVGNGEKALVYLGRYLYRGVISENDIVACADGQVSFRYRDGKTGAMERRTVSGADFLWLVLQACAAQGVPPRAQFRLPASELQAPDRVAASASEVRSNAGAGMGEATRADHLHLLRGGDDDRADADSSAVCAPGAGPDRCRGCALTM